MLPCMLLEFNWLKSLILGFWVILTGYWPVPFSSDEALQISGLTIKAHFKILRGKVFCQKYIFVMKNLTNFCETIELVWIWARRFSSTAASYFLFWYRHNRSSLSTLNVVYIYLIIMKQSTKVTLENHNYFSDSQPFKCLEV